MQLILSALARNGRYALVAGLVAGFLLPEVAQRLKPWLPQMVIFLLFITTLRIGPTRARSGLRNIRPTLVVVLAFQLLVPLTVLTLAIAFGVAQSPYVLAAVLVLSAPALSGSPNLSILLGADPEPAFRLLVLGTALLPITMLPIFWLLPQVGGLEAAIFGALRTFSTIFAAILMGFVASAWLFPTPSKQQTEAIDGVMTIALIVIVVALMGALGPAFQRSPSEALTWMALAFLVVFGMQVATFFVLRRRGNTPDTVPFSIVAGNRNVAIFLVTISPEVAEPLLIFLGCYQVPMYLTPILARPLYALARK